MCDIKYNWLFLDFVGRWGCLNVVSRNCITKVKNQKKIIEMPINKTLNIHELLLSLKAILPKVSTQPFSCITQNPRLNIWKYLGIKEPNPKPHEEWDGPKADVRPHRFLGFLNLPFGAFGNFMGIFNKSLSYKSN